MHVSLTEHDLRLAVLLYVQDQTQLEADPEAVQFAMLDGKYEATVTLEEEPIGPHKHKWGASYDQAE